MENTKTGIQPVYARVYARYIPGGFELRVGREVKAYALRVMPGVYEYLTEDGESGRVRGAEFTAAVQLSEIMGLPGLYRLS